MKNKEKKRLKIIGKEEKRKMKKRAALRTMLDILKAILPIFVGLLCCSLVLYLFFMIPLWIIVGMDLLDKFGNINAGVVYFLELLIYLGAGSIIWMIRCLYKSNLDDEMEKHNSEDK